MRAQIVIDRLLAGYSRHPKHTKGVGQAPANIALVKYWGKRCAVLNLPVTSSLSVSLGSLGSRTQLSLIDAPKDEVVLEGKVLVADHPLVRRASQFLDYFRFKPNYHYRLETANTIPMAAGLASSASAYAALVNALNALFGWQLPAQQRSILARLGSGSACRSLWEGFVEWQRGEREDGMDSYGVPLEQHWPELCIGVLLFDTQPKRMSSREGMRLTQRYSPFYELWPQQVAEALPRVRSAISTSDFMTLGGVAEQNALAMHACMLTSTPPLLYSQPSTLAAMQQVWQLREAGVGVFFTQDAGANLKLLFLQSDYEKIRAVFPDLNYVNPFSRRQIA